MVDSIGSVSGTSSTTSSKIEEEEKKKKQNEEEGLFSVDKQENQNNSQNTNTTITEDTARTTALNYISSLKAQYPQLAAKLDTYYTNLDISSLCQDVASTSDIKAYIYCETQSFLNQ